MHASNCVIIVNWVNFLLYTWRLLYNMLCELRFRIVLHLQLTLHVCAAIVVRIIIVHIANGNHIVAALVLTRFS